MSVAIGDAVTLIRRRYDPYTPTLQTVQTHVFCYATIQNGNDGFATGIDGRRGRRSFNTEGVTWIRGHYPADAPEILALHAANALTFPLRR
jgi:hypothetical protein